MQDELKRRFARHIMLGEIGEDGQQKLLDARVMVVGAGGLGSAVLSYLAAAGIGHLGVIDHDHVELSNLQRQIIHEYADIGRLKVESAADRLSEINPNLSVEIHPHRLVDGNAASILRSYDIVADGCDNFVTRHLVNRTCYALGIPLVSAAVSRFSGQMLSMVPAQHSPCLHCLMPDVPDEPNRCRDVGVLGPLCGIIGAMQATETIKLLLGIGEPLTGRWLRYDGLSHALRISPIDRDIHCPVCQTCPSA